MPDPQNDPAVAGIDAAAMAAFLDGDFAALFADPQWTTSWSSASDGNRTSRIAPNQRIETSVGANEPALRKLTMAYAMVAELGAEKLPAQTLSVIVAKSREILGSALADLTSMQSRIGFMEEQVTTATRRMTLEKDLASKDITSLEGVDPYEAKVRFDTLSSQLDVSYALTTRIMGLSILKYA
jgi:flagellar hook-associated protein 3 FlgL